MRVPGGYRSNDVIDRRGQRAAGGGGGSSAMIGLLGLVLRSRFGWVGALVMLGLYLFMSWGGDGGVTSNRAVGGDQPVAPAAQDELASFVGFTLDDVQDTWQARFPIDGEPYRRAKLVMFTDATETACGFGEAAMGPFYCPADERVYIDLGFYSELRGRLGAPGDFAQAYVIAHEVGHHVQNLLGASDRVHRAPAHAQKGEQGLSVRLELQADCYAGVWASRTARPDIIEKGDIEEAMVAAQAIGDDRLQKMSRGTVQPESFSHGSSEQRARWFRRGLEKGDPAACDTFRATSL
jgi:predicted metalloprotease